MFASIDGAAAREIAVTVCTGTPRQR